MFLVYDMRVQRHPSVVFVFFVQILTIDLVSKFMFYALNLFGASCEYSVVSVIGFLERLK